MTLLKCDLHRHHTYADYLEWPVNKSGELVDGTAYVREPPAPSPAHQAIVCALYYQVAAALEGKPYRAYVAPFDIRLPKSTEDDPQVDTVVQPDVFIVRDLGKIDARGMRGAPDWIAEVLSPGTAGYDRAVKVPAYERAGVSELWLVHPIHLTATIYQLESGRYAHPTFLALKGQTRLTAVPEVTIDWNRVVAGLL